MVGHHPVFEDDDPATSVPADVLTHAHRLRQTEQLAATHSRNSREFRWSQLMPHDLRTSTVVLTVLLTPETEGIGPEQLAATRRNAVLVNGSRGGVVDEKVLLTALEDGHLAPVDRDASDEEPLAADHPFRSHPRSRVTPHTAGFAPDYLEVVSALLTANLRRHLDTAPLLNMADREREY